MATTRSLQGLDWIVRTYGPTLLTACQQPGKASTLAGSQPITSTARLNQAITRLDALEAQERAEYANNPLWDDAWQQAVDKVPAEVTAQCPIPVDEMFADTDQSVRRAIKTAYRALELTVAGFLAGGGTF